MMVRLRILLGAALLVAAGGCASVAAQDRQAAPSEDPAPDKDAVSANQIAPPPGEGAPGARTAPEVTTSQIAVSAAAPESVEQLAGATPITGASATAAPALPAGVKGAAGDYSADQAAAAAPPDPSIAQPPKDATDACADQADKTKDKTGLDCSSVLETRAQSFRRDNPNRAEDQDYLDNAEKYGSPTTNPDPD